jgi:hypothetical protein
MMALSALLALLATMLGAATIAADTDGHSRCVALSAFV